MHHPTLLGARRTNLCPMVQPHNFLQELFNINTVRLGFMYQTWGIVYKWLRCTKRSRTIVQLIHIKLKSCIRTGTTALEGDSCYAIFCSGAPNWRKTDQWYLPSKASLVSIVPLNTCCRYTCRYSALQRSHAAKFLTFGISG